jgi:hypothetical protein
MSMIGNLARVSEQQLAALKADPDSISTFLYPQITNQVEAQPVGFWSKLFGKKDRVSVAEQPLAAVLAPADRIDLDKAWHTLHFLFCGKAWEGGFPEGFLVSCGTAIGNVDVGYGPARSYTHEQVHQIALFLDGLQKETLRAKLIPEQLVEEDIYPNFGSSGPLSDDDWEYISGAFESARAFIRDTDAKGMGLLVFIN